MADVLAVQEGVAHGLRSLAEHEDCNKRDERVDKGYPSKDTHRCGKDKGNRLKNRKVGGIPQELGVELRLHRGNVLATRIRGALLLRWVGRREPPADVVQQENYDKRNGESQEEQEHVR